MRLWPAVLLVWVVRAAVVAVPFVGVWCVWMGTRSWVDTAEAAVPAAGMVWGAIVVAADSSDWLPAAVALRHEIAADDGREFHHAALANHIAARDPGRAERLLRLGVAGGGLPHCLDLIRHLRRPDRAADLEVLLAELATTATRGQLAWAVQEYHREPAIVAPLQGGVAARSGDELDHELHAALLAEIGSFDEALAAHDRAVLARGEREPSEPSVEAILRTARSLLCAQRREDAGRVLRAGGQHREAQQLRDHMARTAVEQ
ncbi:hypothetical protein GCM10010170_010890 [Dactylosporangium salmoneum]|uniref:Tetratricopeptide repeat protein n=1 Tax=Dactylosporangium salmoneum TaxID=53361 RepID=A0ABP5SIQ3_9ACTN